jgi:hypothetical protein
MSSGLLASSKALKRDESFLGISSLVFPQMPGCSEVRLIVQNLLRHLGNLGFGGDVWVG